MIDKEFDAIVYGKIDPHHVLHGKPLPAITTLLYSVCDNDEKRFEEALRLVRLFCEAAVAGK